MQPLFLVVLITLGSAVNAQQVASTSRLLAFGPNGWACAPLPSPPWPPVTCATVASGHSLYEMDPGSAQKIEIPITPPTPPHPGGSTGQIEKLDSAYDPATGRIFIYDARLGGQLHTIDAATGSLIHSVSLGTISLRYMEYDTTASRLIGMELLFFNTPYLVEITPSTGAISNIGNASGYSSVSPMMDINAASAFDPNQNRLTVFTGAVQLVTIDTGTGAEIAVTSPSVSTVSGLIYEASTALLLAYEFTGTGLVHIDPIAGTVTPVGAPHFGAAPGSGFNIPHALDNQKGLYYIRGLSLPSGGPALLTFDTTSGEVVGDPNVQSQGPFFSQAVLEVDVGSTPLRGTLSLSPRNTATYGSTTTVTFDAPANTGELYIPFVSCTQGSYTVPVSPFTIPLALDACTYFYLLDPAASSIFSLTSAPGQLLDMLSPIGTAQGTVSFPPAAPVGLTLHLSITYLTVSQSFQWTNLHGMGTLHLSL